MGGFAGSGGDWSGWAECGGATGAEKAISDGAQSLDLAGFERMMRELKPYVGLWETARKSETMAATA